MPPPPNGSNISKNVSMKAWNVSQMAAASHPEWIKGKVNQMPTAIKWVKIFPLIPNQEGCKNAQPPKKRGSVAPRDGR